MDTLGDLHGNLQEMQSGQKNFGLKFSCYIGIGVNEGLNEIGGFIRFPLTLCLHYWKLNESQYFSKYSQHNINNILIPKVIKSLVKILKKILSKT